MCSVAHAPEHKLRHASILCSPIHCTRYEASYHDCADGTGIGDIVGRLRWNIFIAVNAFSHSENLYGATSRDLLGSALSLT